MNPLHRIGACAAFALSIQYLATIVWIAAAWPHTGIADLPATMAASFLAHSQAAIPFALLNLYNASFAASAVVLVTVLRELLTDAAYLMRLAVIAIIIASGQFVASGIIPIVSIPALVQANDASAVHAIVGVTTGLILGGTAAAGAGVMLIGAVALRRRSLPQLLCYLLIIDGVMEIAEFAVPAFLVLDPVAGSLWSFWLGTVLWRNRPAARPATIPETSYKQ